MFLTRLSQAAILFVWTGGSWGQIEPAELSVHIETPDGATISDVGVDARAVDTGRRYPVRLKYEDVRKVTLPPGKYVLCLGAGAEQIVMPYRRSPVELRSGEHMTITVVPVFRTGTMLEIGRQTQLADPLLKTEVLRQDPELPFEAVITYSEKYPSNGGYVYRRRPDNLGAASLTFDDLTIVARSFHVTNGNTVVSAVGTIFIETRKGKLRGSSVTVDLGSRVISLEGTATRF